MRCLDYFPSGDTLGLVRGDALRHLGIAGLRGRHIDPGPRQAGDQALRIAALARAGAAGDEGDPASFKVGGIRAGTINAGHRVSASGQAPNAMAERPTPTISTPASRGACAVMPAASSRRVSSATPTVSTPWMTTRPRR